MVSSRLLRTLLRSRSLHTEVRQRAVGELALLDPAAMTRTDLGAMVTFIPDLVDGSASEAQAATAVLELLQQDLPELDAVRLERVYPYLPAGLGPLVVGALARQHRPEAWLVLRRVLHLELSQPQHSDPGPDTLVPLGTTCTEPTFVIDVVLEAIEDPVWATQALEVIAAWTDAGVLSEPDLDRCRVKLPLLQGLLAESAGDENAWPLVEASAAATLETALP